jgi:alanine racemase
VQKEDYRVIAEIDLGAIAYNMQEIKRNVSEQTKVMGMVKADAYGHGDIEVAKVLIENGAEQLGVAIWDEGKDLRKQGIDVPILVLGYTSPNHADDLIQYNLIQTVFTYEMAEVLSAAAGRKNKKAKIHIKVDSGMGRIGFRPDEQSIQVIEKIYQLPNITIEGIFTHFAVADEKDPTFTYHQFQLFLDFIQKLEKKEIHIPIKHASNSAGIINFEQMHLNLVRPGVILYGLYPSDEVQKHKMDLLPAMTLKAQVVFIKEVEKDATISYGRTFTTTRKSRIATISVGYADGYSRRLSNKGEVLVKGKRAPVAGTICMDQFMIDISDIPEVEVGEEVVLLGRQQNERITAEEIARKIGTINYEVICMVGKRIPRVYKKDDKVITRVYKK